jgi:hypothetical protein
VETRKPSRTLLDSSAQDSPCAFVCACHIPKGTLPLAVKDLFTPPEWDSLERAPMMVARAVIAADMSGSTALVTE